MSKKTCEYCMRWSDGYCHLWQHHSNPSCPGCHTFEQTSNPTYSELVDLYDVLNEKYQKVIKVARYEQLAANVFKLLDNGNVRNNSQYHLRCFNIGCYWQDKANEEREDLSVCF